MKEGTEMNRVGMLEKLALAACVLACVFALASLGVPTALADDYTIDTDADLVDFADTVNDGVDFAGVTVKLSDDVDMDEQTLVPIGTKEHPFRGIFDGGKNTLNNFTISAEGADAQYLGLFGYVGAGGQVKNLKIGSKVTVTAKSAATVVKCVGSLAGYVYGPIGESSTAVENCSSKATVTVSSTMDASGVESASLMAPEDDLDGKTDNGNTIECVGGLVGYCAGSMAHCSFAGSLNATTHESACESNPVIAHGFGGVVGQVGGYVMDHIEDKASYEPRYPTGGGSYALQGDPGTIAHCTNTGSITVVVDGDNGVDRFGAPQVSNALGTGGVVGYSMADIYRCENEGTVDAAGSDGTGGVVGAVRAIPLSGTSAAASDAGCYKAADADEVDRLCGPKLTVSKCINNAQVSGLHAAGGVVGCAGSYTTVKSSANKWSDALKPGVVGVRWNKPKAGGVVGQTFGDVDHCYNRADCISKTGSGYYIGGVAGALERWEKRRGAHCDTPAPHMTACYTTGVVEKGAGACSAAVCGDNYGTIYGCLYLQDRAKNDDAVGVNQAMVKLATVKALEKPADLMAKQAVADLNAQTSVAEYEEATHFVPAVDADGEQDYPVLAWERADQPGEALEAARLTFEPVVVTSKDADGKQTKTTYSGGVAEYTAGENPAPVLSVSYGGRELVQGADFYALPDPDACESGRTKDVAALDGTTLHARIVGIGLYSSTSAGIGDAPYVMAKGDFGNCTAVITPTLFSNTPQYPAPENVTVLDSGGNEIPTADYEYGFNDPNMKKADCVNYKKTHSAETGDDDGQDHEGYMFKFTPKDASNYKSDTCTYGYFIIQRGNLDDRERIAFDGFEFNGQTWLWHTSVVSSGSYEPSYAYRMVDGEEVRGMQVVYTGETIAPKVLPIHFKCDTGDTYDLVLGKDYRVVYGDPGDVTALMFRDTKGANTDVTTDKPGERACIQVGQPRGEERNFKNYQNVYFDIVQADIAKDCTVEMPSWVYTVPGTVPVTVKGYTGATIPKSNYTVTTKKLSSSKLKVTVAGRGNLKGSIERTVSLKPTPLAKAKVSSTSASVTYTGKALTPAAKVVFAGVTLKKGTDYTVRYKRNKAIGTASVTVTGKGRCTGTATATFKIVPKGTKLKKPKTGKKSFTAMWAKQAKQTHGYQLRYSLKKSMKGAKTVTVKKAKTTKVLVKKLKAKKTYYVQVCTYKKVGSKMYCSAWSATKSVKTK